MKFSAAALKDLPKESIFLSLTSDDGIPEAIARGIVDDLISDTIVILLIEEKGSEFCFSGGG
jgi:hypothetical protein